MKRFYRVVSHEKTSEGFAILLDGREVKTKSGVPLLALHEDIANEVVKEWAGQSDVINPETMPFTQILNTKIDHVSQKRDVMRTAILKYLDTDLLCYIAAEPKELALLQDHKWSKWREWMEQEFGHYIKTTTGLTALSQPKELIENVGEYIDKSDDDHFTLLQIIVPLSGSLILAMAMLGGAASARDVFDACFVEEQFKDSLYDVEKYGVDPHESAQQTAMMRDLQACEDYLKFSTQ